MAFGDVAETITGAIDSTALTVTYESATPAANDHNYLSAFTGATSITSLTTGFTQRQDLTDGSNDDEGTVAEQLVTDGDDNSCTLTPSDSDEIMMILSLVRGAFQAGVDTVGVSSGPESTDDPQTTGVGSATAQALEVQVCCLTQRNAGDDNPTWGGLGTAVPTGAPTETAFISSGGAKGCYQSIKVLTAAGTLGVTASNGNSYVNMLGYATFKAEAAAEADFSAAWGAQILDHYGPHRSHEVIGH